MNEHPKSLYESVILPPIIPNPESSLPRFRSFSIRSLTYLSHDDLVADMDPLLQENDLQIRNQFVTDVIKYNKDEKCKWRLWTKPPMNH